MAPNESPYMVSYTSIIEITCVLLSAVFEIFVKIAFLTFDLGPRSKVMTANESPYMISYMSVIQMKSLSLIVFVIFVKIAFLTFDLGPSLILAWIQQKTPFDSFQTRFNHTFPCQTVLNLH